MLLTGTYFSDCNEEFQSYSLGDLILKSTQLQSNEICSAMKQH